MLSAAASLLSRFGPSEALSRRDMAALSAFALLQVAALVILAATEVDFVAKVAFLLAWAFLNFFWLAALRRPVAASLISLTLIVALILLSRFKHDKLWMTVDFVDLMIIDQDTFAFLLTAMPALRLPIALAALTLTPLTALAWHLDPFRIRLRVSAPGAVLCLGALTLLSLAQPTELYEDFFSHNYVSKFARTGVEAMRELMTHGYLESEAVAAESLKAPAVAACNPARKLPHIILLHDESSFDITAAPGIKVPAGYHNHFRSFDGAARKLVVEGAGGPSWFTEYNVLTGLSARSYGRFATSVTRIASGRVARGLAHSLTHCGYKTFTLYPFYGAFLSSRAFQTTAGIESYLDMRDLGTRGFERDTFYFEKAEKIIARERGNGPLFLYVYTVANHFPWDKKLRPELTPNWRDLGNPPNIDEYIRRQGMTAQEYAAWLERLKQNFPTESFLIVRYGDHQPEFGYRIIDPSLSEEAVFRQLAAADPRYFTSYYAVDAVNFKPVDMSDALPTLDAPYIPLLVQETAGVPLDPSFAEQKKILQRCHGQFFRCAGGAEARRFNRLLIDAGLIKGL
jgi:hypothetical protein